MANELTIKSFEEKVNSYKASNWDDALPAKVNAAQFTRSVISYVKNNDKLLQCNTVSLFSAFFAVAQLGLYPDKFLGQAYVIPYGKEATVIVGYRGYLTLAYRNPLVKDIIAEIVYERDEFSFERGSNPKITHNIYPFGSRGKKVGAYAICRFKNGGEVSRVLSEEEILARKKRSKSSENGPWVTDENEMWLKTTIRLLAKWLPMCTELQSAVEYEDSIERGEKVTLKDGSVAIIPEDKPDLNHRFSKQTQGTVKNAEVFHSAEEPIKSADSKADFYRLVKEKSMLFVAAMHERGVEYNPDSTQLTDDVGRFVGNTDLTDLCTQMEESPEMLVNQFATWMEKSKKKVA